MNQQKTKAIVLTRVNYGEADRIITVLTPDVGKLSLMAKGVRRLKSKLAGGIELFSTSEIVYVPSQSNLKTLISARLIKHYGQIVTDIERTMVGYELIKLLNTLTEDMAEEAYFVMLEEILAALNDSTISIDIIRVWFSAQLLRLAGHMPNLLTTHEGIKLEAKKKYEFDFEATAFRADENGSFAENDIKFMRLIFANSTPRMLANVSTVADFVRKALPVIITLRQLHLNK